MKEQKMLFILGRERSGTTLLQNLMNNHSCIFIPDEAAFIVFLSGKYENKNPIDPEEFVNDLFKEPYIPLWNINKNKLLQQLTGNETKDFSSYCKVVLNYHNHKASSYVGDKNPVNSVFSLSLIKNFKNAKFIWLIRDYRAQVNSMLKVNFERKNCTSLAIRWKQYNKQIEKIEQNFPEKIFKLRYEDLVTETEKSLQSLCCFLEIEFDAKMLENNDSGQRIALHHKSLQEKINKKNIEAWKWELSFQQQRASEILVGKYAKKFGYHKEHQYASLWDISFSGLLLGYSYVPFLLFFQGLPIPIKNWVVKKLIQPNFRFWKESLELIEKKDHY